MRTIFFMTLMFGALTLSAAEKNLFIVTTDKIVGSSAKLAEFVAAKEARGFTVTLATQTDYGAKDKQGFERAVAIRAWLTENTAPGDYLLLIGDANAQYGDVPMFIVWPRHTYSAADAPDEDATLAEGDPEPAEGQDEDTATDTEMPDIEIAERGSDTGCALVTL